MKELGLILIGTMIGGTFATFILALVINAREGKR